jgi:hypothetical protein
MKKCILVLSGVLMGLNSNAQLNNMLKNKLNEKLSKGSKTESGQHQNNTDSTSSNSTGTSAQPNNSSGGYGAFSMGSKSDIAAEYAFVHNMHIEVESIKKGATSGDKNNMILYIGNDNANLSGMEMKTDPKKPDDKIISVYEYGKDQTVTYMHSDGKKNVMVSKYKYTQVDTTQQSAGPKFTKTGKTKIILNYACEQWIGTDDKGNNYEIWITNAVDFPVNEYLRKNAEAQKSRGRSNVDYSNMPKGVMLEMTSVAKDGDKVTWKVTVINLNKPFTVKTSEYEYMGF